MTVGERIRAARKRAGMTLEEVSDKLGISYQSFAQWETGKRKPKYETLQRISDVLQVPVESLIHDDERSAEMSNTPEIFVPGGTVTEEEVKKLSDKIAQEAERQGLPWWSGMFNPEITKMAFKDRPAEKTEQEEAAEQREAQFEQDMDDLRKIQKERDRLLLEADKAALEAIQTALDMMKSLQEVDKDKGVVAMGAADLGRAIAALRESMNQKHYPIGYGWTA